MSLILDGTNGLSDVDGTAATPAIRGTDTNTGIFFPAADTIAFAEGGTEVARFDSSGNLNLGATTNRASSKLDIRGDVMTLGSNALYYSTIDYNAGTGLLTLAAESGGGIRFNSGTTERMRITSGGNLEMASSSGILQTATNQTIRMPSTGGIGYVGNINSATVFQIAYNSTSAGVQLSSGATSWGTFSDSRLKNITGTYTNALNDIAQIQPIKFTWKSDEDNKPQVGVIAQSVQNVVPESVDSTTIEMDGIEEYLTVRYTELIPLMIASIQELKATVDAQAARIAALENPPVESVTNE